MDQQGNPIGQHPYEIMYPPNHGPHSSVQSAGTDFPKHMATYQQINLPDHHDPELRQQLQTFWSSQTHEIEKANDFKNHSLPLARIKKIMKADGDVRMISAEAPVIFARACEMFILELTLRSWNHTEENRRRTLQKNDIAASISKTDIFDFLVDTVPKEEALNETVPVVAQHDAHPYYYVQAPENTPVMMGTPVVDPNLYGQQSQAYMAPAMWQQPPPHMRAPPPHMQLPPSDN